MTKKTPMVHMMDYFKSEYLDAERIITQKVSWANPKEVVYNCMQRMLGVAMYIQRLDYTISYDEVEQIYNFYKEKLENLLTDQSRSGTIEA